MGALGDAAAVGPDALGQPVEILRGRVPDLQAGGGGAAAALRVGLFVEREAALAGADAGADEPAPLLDELPGETPR